MKTLSTFILILMSLSGTTSSADSNCESEVHPGIAALVGLTRTMIERQSLTEDDLRAMIDGDVIENPFRRKPRSDFNLSFGRGLERVIHEVRDIKPAAKAALTKLRDEILGHASQVADAKENTRRIVIPEVMLELDSLGAPHQRLLTWHRTIENELQFVAFYPQEQKLRIYSPKNKTPLIDRTLGVSQRGISLIHSSQGSLSTRDGRLFIASTGKDKERSRILVHDVVGNKTFEQATDGTETIISLFEDTLGDVYLMMTTMSSLEIFKVQNGIHYTKSIKLGVQILDKEIINGPQGRAAALVKSERSVHLVDLPSGKILRHFPAPHKVLQTKAALVGDQDYAISVAYDISSQSSQMHLAFLTSRQPRPVEIPFPMRPGNLGDFEITKDGHVLVPLLIYGKHGRGHIFDIFHSPVETKWVRYFPPTRRSFIKPSKSFSVGNMDITEMQWLETNNDLILSVAYALRDDAPRINQLLQWEQKNFSINAPEGQPGKLINRVNAINYNFLLAEVHGQQVLVHSHAGATSALQAIDVETGFYLTTSVGGSRRIEGALQNSQNGDLIFASTDKGNRDDEPIYIIRMVKER